MKKASNVISEPPYKKSVLVIEDNLFNFKILNAILEKNGFQVFYEAAGWPGISNAKKNRPDIILLDVGLPDIDGLEVCRILKREEQTADIPILFISIFDETKDKIHAFEAGGVDYVTKPFQKEEILARVKTHLALKEMREKLQKNNRRLEEEIRIRKCAEIELQKINANLEERVLERTRLLKESETRYRELFNRMGGGVAIFQWMEDENEFRILDLNRSLENMLGYKKDDLIGKSVFEAFDNEQLLEIREVLKRVRKTRQPTRCSIESHENGRLVFAFDQFVYMLPTGELVAIYHDETEKKISALKTKHQELQLIEADKLASLGTLVAGVAHEINTPNGVILLNADMLRKCCKEMLPVIERLGNTDEIPGFDETSGRKFRRRVPFLVDSIADSSRRIKRIVQDLKDFARRDLLETSEQVNLNEVVRASVRLVSNRIGKSTRYLEINYSERPLIVKGRFQQLEQVLINLLLNACDALPDSGQSIFVSVFPEPSQNMAVIQVKDEGKGISEKDLPHIFDPFFTTKRDQGGTGLGLSISQRIILDHGGFMEFDSLPGKGTTCSVFLPLENMETSEEDPDR